MWIREMRCAGPFLLSWLLLVSVSSAEGDTTGSICVAPLPDHAQAADHDMPHGKPQRRESTYEFTIQVDERNAVEVPKDGKPIFIAGLELRKRHRMVIHDGGQQIESFYFTFESRGSSRLCVSYTPWYQTWQLDPPRPKAGWCDCGPESGE